jgi:hypothetical protein
MLAAIQKTRKNGDAGYIARARAIAKESREMLALKDGARLAAQSNRI